MFRAELVNSEPEELLTDPFIFDNRARRVNRSMKGKDERAVCC